MTLDNAKVMRILNPALMAYRLSGFVIESVSGYQTLRFYIHIPGKKAEGYYALMITISEEGGVLKMTTDATKTPYATIRTKYSELPDKFCEAMACLS